MASGPSIHEPSSFRWPKDPYTFNLREHEKIAVSRHDGIATGNDRSRQDMSILWISESGELARTSFVSSTWNDFHTKQRKDFLGLFSAAREPLVHDLQDLSLDILRDDERVLPAECG